MAYCRRCPCRSSSYRFLGYTLHYRSYRHPLAIRWPTLLSGYVSHPPKSQSSGYITWPLRLSSSIGPGMVFFPINFGAEGAYFLKFNTEHHLHRGTGTFLLVCPVYLFVCVPFFKYHHTIFTSTLQVYTINTQLITVACNSPGNVYWVINRRQPSKKCIAEALSYLR